VKAPKHVCILGCGRSGTSIFGELFQSIADYTYYSEPTWEEFTKIDFSTPVAIKVPRGPIGFASNNGLPFTLNDFYQVFPSSGLLFWQVRHPLDTICSLKVGISNDWGHHPQPPDHKQWLNRSLVEQCAHHWNYINTRGFETVRDQVIINKFEDMVLNPKGTAAQCLSLLQVDPEASQEKLNQWTTKVQDKNNGNFVEALCSRPYSTNDHKVKVGRWKQNLSPTEVEIVLPMIGKSADRFGYLLPEI
jgi:hypothetical protein